MIINKQTAEKNNEKVVTREIVHVLKKKNKNKSCGSRTVHLKLLRMMMMLVMRMMSSSRDQ